MVESFSGEFVAGGVGSVFGGIGSAVVVVVRVGTSSLVVVGAGVSLLVVVGAGTSSLVRVGIGILSLVVGAGASPVLRSVVDEWLVKAVTGICTVGWPVPLMIVQSVK